MQRRATFRPRGQVLTMRVRVTVTDTPAEGAVRLTDIMLQAGSFVTGWTPNVTELPWSEGIVGG